nr:uncharacterized protein C4orf45 homolog isoform X2 [Pogona vitticeps]
MAKGSHLSSRPSIPPIDTGKRIIFTGPDGTGDYQTRLPDHTRYVGTTTSPVEGTSDTAYLWRPAPYNLPPWCHRHCFVGEIGWGVYGYFHQRCRSWTRLTMPERSPPPEEYEMINKFRNPRY